MDYRYEGSGDDSAGGQWNFTLELDIADADDGDDDDDNGDEDRDVSGTFSWDGPNDRYGDEDVSGTVDTDGNFDLQGTSLKNESGIVLCHYWGQFSSDYSSIEGQWEGNCPSGSFSGS